MTKYCVKLKGAPKIIHIKTETFEGVPDALEVLGGGPSDRIAKGADGKEIAYFHGKDIAGWWIESVDFSSLEDPEK